MTMIAEFSIVPLGKGVSVSAYVAQAVKLVEESGLDYRLTPMGTIVEGDCEAVFDLIRRCHSAVAGDCERVLTRISIDDRRTATPRMKQKIKSVEERLGHDVEK